jgi:hypothetical protein
MMSNVEDFRKDLWGVHPVFDVPDIFPPAVIFSILDRDPRARFKEVLMRMSESRNRLRLESPPAPGPELMRQGLLIAAWDSVFHEVPGDQMALVYRNENRRPAGLTTDAETMRSVMLKSNGPAGTKWLVTRATQFEGKPVCWCIPVDVEAGKNSDVWLTTQNMIALDMN